VVGAVVWSIDPTDGAVQALALADGAPVFRSDPRGAAESLPHFITPRRDGQAILAARGRTVTAFARD
jgi:hypothetical protein